MAGEQHEVSAWWAVQRGDGPVVATAIHDGNGLRGETRQAMALNDADRLHEEDPFTGHTIVDVPNHVVAGRSRFEIDLNRGIDSAVYRTPDQSWGMKVWRDTPDDGMVARSLKIHTDYYAMLGQMLDGIEKDFGRFVLLDVHSYNHRRDGPQTEPTPQERAPEINIGTFSMPRGRWAFLLDPLIEAMRAYDFGGRRLDVRENVAFQGKGEQTRFVHERYPESGCAIAIEFKKFFMNEWTGEPDSAELALMRGFMSHVACTAHELLDAA